MIDIGVLQFQSPEALVLLLAFPLWWWRRSRRETPAITFSRVPALLRGPRAGRFVTRLLFVLRNLVLLGAERDLAAAEIRLMQG